MPPRRKVSGEGAGDEVKRRPGRPPRESRTPSEPPQAPITNKRIRQSSSPVKQSIETDDPPRTTRTRTRRATDPDFAEYVDDIDKITRTPSASRKTPGRAGSRQTSAASHGRPGRATTRATYTNDVVDADLSIVYEENIVVEDALLSRAGRPAKSAWPSKSAKVKRARNTKILDADESYGDDASDRDAETDNDQDGAHFRISGSNPSPLSGPSGAAIRGRTGRAGSHLASDPSSVPTELHYGSPRRSSDYSMEPLRPSVHGPFSTSTDSITHPVASSTQTSNSLFNSVKESPSRQFSHGYHSLPPAHNNPYSTRHSMTQASPGRAQLPNPFRTDVSISANGIPQFRPSSTGIMVRRPSIQQSSIVDGQILRKTSSARRQPLFTASTLRAPVSEPEDESDNLSQHSDDDNKKSQEHPGGFCSNHYGKKIWKAPRVQAAINYLPGYDSTAIRSKTHHEDAYNIANGFKTFSEVFMHRIAEAVGFLGTRWISVPVSAFGAGALFTQILCNHESCAYNIPSLLFIRYCLRDPVGVAACMLALFLFLIGICDVITGVFVVFRGIVRRTWMAAQTRRPTMSFFEALGLLWREWIWDLMVDNVNHVFPPATMLILTLIPIVRLNTSVGSDGLQWHSSRPWWRYLGVSSAYHLLAWFFDCLSRYYGPYPPSRVSLRLYDFWTKALFSSILIVYLIHYRGLIGQLYHSVEEFYFMAKILNNAPASLTGSEQWCKWIDGQVAHLSFGPAVVMEEAVETSATLVTSASRQSKAITSFATRGETGLQVQPIGRVSSWSTSA